MEYPLRGVDWLRNRCDEYEHRPDCARPNGTTIGRLREIANHIATLESQIAELKEENETVCRALDDMNAAAMALESQLADRHAERVREIDAHMERVAELEAQLAQYRWRRVEEEMPDAEMYVLTFDCGYLIETYVDDEGVWWSKEFDAPIHGIKVWMPLPPAPEEGE